MQFFYERPYEILIYGFFATFMFGSIMWFLIVQKLYSVIDDKYFIYRQGHWFIVKEFDHKNKMFKSYHDCIAYIEQRKKEDE